LLFCGSHGSFQQLRGGFKLFTQKEFVFKTLISAAGGVWGPPSTSIVTNRVRSTNVVPNRVGFALGIADAKSALARLRRVVVFLFVICQFAMSCHILARRVYNHNFSTKLFVVILFRQIRLWSGFGVIPNKNVDFYKNPEQERSSIPNKNAFTNFTFFELR
jgi:uncharacterized membrane protein YoaK (UPF0700 family)